MSVLDKAAERCARQDRAMPKVPGLAASQLQGEMSTGHWRVKAKESHHPHAAGAARRFGAKPSGGKVDELYAGSSLNGQDDGTDYFADWRGEGGIFELPKPKTPKQDALHRLCIAFIGGEDLGEGIEEGMRSFIGKIIATDPDHGSAWRLTMTAAGLFR